MSQTTVTKTEAPEFPIIMAGKKIDIKATAEAIYPLISTKLTYMGQKMTGSFINHVSELTGHQTTFRELWGSHFPVAKDGTHDFLMGWAEYEKLVEEMEIIHRTEGERLARADYARRVMDAAPAKLEECDYQNDWGEMYRFRGQRGWRIIRATEEREDGAGAKPIPKYYSEDELRRLIGIGIVGKYSDYDDDDKPHKIEPVAKLTATQKKIQADAEQCHVKIKHQNWTYKWANSFMVLDGDSYTLYKKHVAWFRKNLKYQWQGREGTEWENIDGKYWACTNEPLCRRIFGDLTEDAFDRDEDMEDHPEKYMSKVLIDLIHQRTPLFAKDVLWQTPCVSDDIMYNQIIGALLTELRCPPTMSFQEFRIMVISIVKSIEIDRTPYLEMYDKNGGHATDEDLELTNPEALM